jgi:hypothetical protein
METYGKHTDDSLHIDVTTAKRDYGDDQQFLEELETYESIQGFKYLPPLLVAQRKFRSEHRRRKDDKDIELIHRHIERSKIN